MSHSPCAMVSRMAALAIVAVLSCGCDDLLEEATTFTFCSDSTNVALDVDALGLDTSGGSTVPVVPCESPAPCAAVQTGLGCDDNPSCAVECGTQQRCELVARVQSSAVVDISQKVKNQTQASLLAKVTVKSVKYAVPVNSLTFQTPQIEIHVGPQGSETPNDAGVARLGRIEPVDAGATFSTTEMETEQAGRTRLAELVRDYRTPFRVLVPMQTRVAGGDPVPAGKLQAEVILCFRAQLL